MYLKSEIIYYLLFIKYLQVEGIMYQLQLAQCHTCGTLCTGCLKKMVIEFWSALARSLYNLQKSFFHSRKDQAFRFRMSPFL